jgi:hypothetical protein
MKMLLPILYTTGSAVGANLLNPHISNIGIMIAMCFGIGASIIALRAGKI